MKFVEWNGNKSEKMLAWEFMTSTIYILSRYGFYRVLIMYLKILLDTVPIFLSLQIEERDRIS